MIIMQRKKKLWYTIRLCYKVIFYFGETHSHFEYSALSYTPLMEINDVVFSKKKMLYNDFEDPIIYYPFYGVILETFKVRRELRWTYRRERRSYGYQIWLRMPFLSKFRFVLFNRIYFHYSMFFSSFYYRNNYVKNYNVYKSTNLVEYLWKFHFPYENKYFEAEPVTVLSGFSLEKEFIKKGYFHIDDSEDYEYAIEFFYFKKYLFKNKFYSFFFRNNTYLFTKDNSKLNVTDSATLDDSHFYTYRCHTVNNYILNPSDLLFEKKSVYDNSLLIMYYVYNIQVLLFIW